jgi:hypothetical protein
MDWNRVEGNWKQMKGKVKEQWGKLTDDDLTSSTANGSNSRVVFKSVMAMPRTRQRRKSTTGMDVRVGNQHV